MGSVGKCEKEGKAAHKFSLYTNLHNDWWGYEQYCLFQVQLCLSAFEVISNTFFKTILNSLP